MATPFATAMQAPAIQPAVSPARRGCTNVAVTTAIIHTRHARALLATLMPLAGLTIPPAVANLPPPPSVKIHINFRLFLSTLRRGSWKSKFMEP